MTDSGNENNDDKATNESAEASANEEQNAATGAEDNSAQSDESANSSAAVSADANQDADELPEYEELTPEIVEEEAIRGDFMLRWAAIFLAVLFGFSQMADTRTLLHVRSGEDMQSGGFLPPSEDSFSYALEGQSTSNVSWLFDHIVSTVYSLGGEYALTVFKAVVAGVIAYLLSYISLKNMPTWWSSVCVVFGMAACSVDFMPVTDLATLLGLAITLLLLHRHTEGAATGLAWKLPVVIVVWCNCDPRAYLGVIAILLFAAGSHVRKSLAEKAGDPPGGDPSTLWKAAGFGLVALLLNPSPVASLMSAATTYSIEYPTMAAMKTLTDATAILDGRTEYYSIFTPGVLQGLEFAYVAGFSIVIIAFVVLALGRSREDLPWLLLCIGFTALALWKLHELPAAALVAAAAAGTAAQRWYARTFRQEYTIDTMEVLFSRGGRAVTVLAMATLGFFAVADRLPTRTAIGLGFSPMLRETIDSLKPQLAELPEDAKLLNTRISQGDLLAWHGRKSFIDSRTGIFGSLNDDESIAAKFDSLRKSLVAPPATAAGTEEATLPPGYNADWLTEYNDYGITQVMLRLSPPGRPAYPMVRRFMQDQAWNQSSRGPSAVFFRRTDDPTEPSPYNVRDIAFRTESPDDEEANADSDAPAERFDFAREPGFYEQYLYRKRRVENASLREAQHILELDTLPAQITFNIANASGGDPANSQYMAYLGRALGAPMLAIRSANKALLADPQNDEAYRTLGNAYLSLLSTEQAIATALNGKDVSDLRYMQAVMAFRQATTVQPDDSDSWRRLTGLYAERNRFDLALECVNRYLELEEDALLENPDAEAVLTETYENQNRWKTRDEEIRKQLEEITSQPMPEDPQQQAMQKLELARGLAGNGHVLLALEQIKKDEGLLQRLPQGNLLRGELLTEAGKLEDAYQILTQLGAAAKENQNSPEFAGIKWHSPVAISYLSKGEYEEAVLAYQSNINIFDRFESKSPDMMKTLVQLLPLIPAVDALGGGSSLPGWPLTLLQQGQIPFSMIPTSRNEPRFMTGLAELELGNLKAAEKAFTKVLAEGGETPYRQLAAIYLLQLTDDAVTTIVDSYVSPWEDFTFPEADSAGKSGDNANDDDTPTNEEAEEQEETKKEESASEQESAEEATDN